MKLRTSFFNPAAFRKDLTRFAPAWVLYTVGLFMMLSACMMDNTDYFQARDLAQTVSFMAAANLGYGLLNAQLLFGDLFSARQCNALHAIHLRRECWFFTHITAGLLFALVPNLLMSLIAMAMMGAGWQVGIWWLAASMLQYLFFFGLAVCSALCVGNRFAMVLVYGIVNFFSIIVYWFVYSIYQPLLYGVRLAQEPFTRFCPIWTMVDSYDLIDVIPTETEAYMMRDVASVRCGDGWGYLGICAAIGVGLLAVALVLYRRRKLECAGDFMAVRALEPVFLVLYTLSMAAFFQVFADMFGMSYYPFLALGLVVGFFTGRMLLMRTIRVFQPRSFLWFGILALAFIISMVVTRLDPVGVTRRIPDTGNVKAVYLSQYYYDSGIREENPALTAEQDIDEVRRMHQLILDGEIHNESAGDVYSTPMCITYVLENGIHVSRYYEQVDIGSPVAQIAAGFFTRPEYILGSGDADAIVAGMNYVFYNDYTSDYNGELDPAAPEIRQLVEAILADCAEGTMAQPYSYYNVDTLGWLELHWEDVNGEWHYRSMEVCENNRNVLAFLETAPLLESEKY